MPRRSLYLALGLSAATLTSTARATTLDAAMSDALASSPDLGSARASFLKSTAAIAIAASHGHFQLGISSVVSHDFDNDPYSPSLRDESSLRLSIPLYSGGRVRDAVEAARFRASAAASGINARADDLRIAVAQQYDRILDAGDLVSLGNDEVAAIDRHQAMISGERSEGFATRTDEAQANARLSLARAKLETALGRQEEARISYYRVVGEAPGTLLQPIALTVSDNVQRLTDRALSYSPALNALRDRVRAAARDVQITKALGRPTLSFVATASYGNTDMRLAETMRFPHRVFGKIGLALTVPFYSGGQVSSQTARALAAAQQEQANLETGRRELVADVRNHYAAYKAALARIASADRARDAASHALDGVRIEHEAGTRTALDLLNAQRELSESRGEAARARRVAHFEAVTLLVRAGEFTDGSPKSVAPNHAHNGGNFEVAELDFDLSQLAGTKQSAESQHSRVSSAGLPYVLDELS